MPYHHVRQGECLSYLAWRAGLPSWRTIYDHPNNMEFRSLRPNPNIIYPGDRLFIPDVSPRVERGSTETRHHFMLRRETLVLRLAILDERWQPLAGARYNLLIGLEAREGTLDANGRLNELISLDTDEAELMVYLDDNGDECMWKLRLRSLDPISTVTGVQGRLLNLGYDLGQIDGILGPLTRSAISAFQRDQGLEITGDVDGHLRRRLEEVHDHERSDG